MPNNSNKLRPAVCSHIEDDCHSTHCQIDSLRYQFDFTSSSPAAFAIRNPTAKQTHRKYELCRESKHLIDFGILIATDVKTYILRSLSWGASDAHHRNSVKEIGWKNWEDSFH